MAGLSSLASKLAPQISERTSAAIIIGLDEKDEIKKDEIRRFQYFPETLQDSKQVAYQKFDIPGGSLPIYQWISSGERLISFDTVFTTDTNLGTRQSNNLDVLADKISRLDAIGAAARNVDIRSAIVWLRRFMLPRYTSGVATALSQAPRKLILYVPGSGIGLSGGSIASASSVGTDSDSVLAIMTACDVAYEAFFPNGLPRIATVTLAFAQIAQRGGFVHFPAADDVMDREVSNTSSEFAGYTLVEKGPQE